MRTREQRRQIKVVARQLAAAMDRGQVLISVPRYLAQEIRVYAWRLGLDHAATRWASYESEISLSQWKAAAMAKPKPDGWACYCGDDSQEHYAGLTVHQNVDHERH